ncbi:hypothetical protein ABEB36_013185 [Hypothenemus hampei]|uniref:Uncharacterized protein n=1 Tax=Hypothenemus hampei TaxID=57062 RepID=A0ABD1E764_HYPHA
MERIILADQHANENTREDRMARRQQKIEILEACTSAEGLLYGPGVDDSIYERACATCISLYGDTWIARTMQSKRLYRFRKPCLIRKRTMQPLVVCHV